MIPGPVRRRAGAALTPLLAALVAALVVAGCGAPSASFSTSGACLADGRAPGVYPELEGRLPRTLDGRSTASVDSGRNCSERALGSLAARGIAELRFAGAVWDEGEGAGTSIAILGRPAASDTAPGWAALPATWVEEFYEAGARASSKTSNVATNRPVIGGAGVVWRLDALNDLSQQTVVVRPLGDLVQVVLVATRVGPDASLDEHNRRVDLAVEVAAGVVLPSPS